MTEGSVCSDSCFSCSRCPNCSSDENSESWKRKKNWSFCTLLVYSMLTSIDFVGKSSLILRIFTHFGVFPDVIKSQLQCSFCQERGE